jgi:hypothetical protein
VFWNARHRPQKAFEAMCCLHLQSGTVRQAYLREVSLRRRRKLIVSGLGVDSSGSGKAPMMGACEHNNEHSGSMSGELLDQLRDY